MRMTFNAYGDEIVTGRTYYTIKHISVSRAGGSFYRNLGYTTPVIVKSEMPVVIRIARENYKCESCGANIDKDTLYAKPTAKFATNKYCIDCISSVREGDIIEELKPLPAQEVSK